MKYGEITDIKFVKSRKVFERGDLSVCNGGLEEICDIELTTDPITLKAFDKPDKDRHKIVILDKRCCVITRVCGSRITKLTYVDVLKALGVYDGTITVFWLEVWQ